MKVIKFEIKHAINMRSSKFNKAFRLIAMNGILEKILNRNEWTGYTGFEKGEVIYIGVMFRHPKIKNCAVIMGGSSYCAKKYAKELYRTTNEYFKKMIDDLKVDQVHAYIETDFVKGQKWAEHFGFKFMGEVSKGYESGNLMFYRWEE